MSRTAYKEPQCLYKGALYLTFSLIGSVSHAYFTTCLPMTTVVLPAAWHSLHLSALYRSFEFLMNFEEHFDASQLSMLSPKF